MVETISNSSKFEHYPHREIEKKYLPIFPETLLNLRKTAYSVEQYYLSHPSEPFSLRFRETTQDNGSRYTATLKDRGEATSNGLNRLEVEIEVSGELYNYYKSLDAPLLRKLRKTINKRVCVDFFEDSHIQIESEDPIAWVQATEQLGNKFIDISGERLADNEWRAHFAYRQEHDGQEALCPEKELESAVIAREIAHAHMSYPHVIVQIPGRSGSGKSTIVAMIKRELTAYGIESIVLSTDDYHRGATWLKDHNSGQEWTKWDDAIVYDIDALTHDIRLLQSNTPIKKRKIDFYTAEPVVDSSSSIIPPQVTLIEGLYAGAKELDTISHLKYVVPTPFVTSVGRRLLRDIKERPQFANPQLSLKYILEEAEPAWRDQCSSFKT